MECAKCLALLDDFLDGTLVSEDRALLAAHLDECLPCASTRQDFDLIIQLARELREEFNITPPDTLKSTVFTIISYQATAT
jgi:predicted anti-sigma-YlaC factor YlaD